MISYSVVIPSYKTSYEVMLETINSVLNQDYPIHEIIVVDDNGGDEFSGENKKIQEHFGEKVAVLFNEVNKGANFSRNRGVKQASGDFIAFLDSDDNWSKNYLSLVANIIESNDAKFVTSNYQIVHEDGVLPPEFTRTIFISGDISKKELYQDYVGPTSTVVISRQLVIDAGLFDETLPARQDYDMWLRVSKLAYVFYNYEPCVKVLRIGRASISSSYKRNVRGTQLVLKKILENNNLTLPEQRAIKASHFKHMALSCILCNAYKDSREYAKESLKNEFDIKMAIWYLLSFSPMLFSMLRKMRRRYLYAKKS